MRATVRTFWAFVLLTLAYGLSSSVVTTAGMTDGGMAACEAGVSSSLLRNDSSADGVDTISRLLGDSLLMCSADMVLADQALSERHPFNFQRLRRAMETTVFLKGILLCLSRHQNLLARDRSKLYYSDKDPHYTSFSSEYYIYALRRIVI